MSDGKTVPGGRRQRILATAPLRGEGLRTLEALGDVTLDPWIGKGPYQRDEPVPPLRIYDADQLASRITDLGASIVICEADTCSGPVLDLGLTAICSTRGDPTNVDVAGATERGIPVLHAPARNADGVAELAVGLALAVTRGILPADSDVRQGQVFRDGTIPYQRFRAWQLRGRTIGLVGLGAVGRAARWRFEALGMRVISFDPYNAEATHSRFEDLLGEADIVSMHASPTPETAGMMDSERFDQMRQGSVFLNTARAVLHDLGALTDALASGHLCGAGLDHFEGEVLPPDHPLASMSNVVLTPHIGGATYDTEINHTRIIAEDLSRLLEGGRPLHCANPEVLV